MGNEQIYQKLHWIGGILFALLLGGCVVVPAGPPRHGNPHKVTVVHPSPPPPILSPSASIIVPLAPPPPRVEVRPPAPRPGYVWVPGYWKRQGENWVWEPGRWEQPPHGKKSWVPPRWEQTPQGWKWVPGYWK